MTALADEHDVDLAGVEAVAVSFLNSFVNPDHEIAAAERLLQRAAEHEETGSGVFIMDGRMVDAPMIRAAEAILERARLCGLID